ncbi:MAG: glycosyltransferase [Candidatus Kapaibacterium sp.]
MKILQLAPQFPFPENDGGKIGIASTFKQLSKENDVTFFCFTDGEPKESLIEFASSFGRIIYFKHNIKNTISRKIQSLYKKEPLYLFKYNSDAAYKLIRKFCEDENFDFIHADHTAMAPLALKLKKEFGIKAGLRLHNVEYMIWQRYADVLPEYNPLKYFIQMQANKLKIREGKLLSEFDVCFPITESDSVLAQELSPSSVLVTAGPGINLENWNRMDMPKNPNTLIHATTYDWIHNVDAVRWFIDNVMPDLVSDNPEINLQLLGKNPPGEFRNNKNVEVLGFVPSVAPYLSSAGVYVAPLFVGGGIRLKILEAMAMEMPVVASPVSAEGIKAFESDGLFIAENAEEFRDKILQLTSNPKNASELGVAAKRFVHENYSFEKTIGIINNTYNKLRKL